MAALAKDRITKELASGGASFADPVAANAKIYRGAMVGLDAAGNAVPAAAATPVMRGVAVDDGADNTGGAAGAASVRTRRGVFHLNQTGLNRTHIGKTVYVLDDNTVGTTNTNLAAGKLVDLDATGAWVEIR